MDLVLQSYRTGDEQAILELYERAFHQTLSIESWRWRFQDNPAGPGIIELAWDGNCLAGHYAVSPVVMRFNDVQVSTGLSGTTMTHPDYRGQGLFTLLAERTYDRMTQFDMAMVWGFPNILSHRGFIRDLNWTDIYEIPTFRISNSSFSRLPASKKVTEITRFDDSATLLWSNLQNSWILTNQRDKAYLNWRYFQNPSQSYRVFSYEEEGTNLGYAVFKQFREELQIVDLLFTNEEIAVNLVSRVIELAAQKQLKSASLWLNVFHPLHRLLEKFGFVNGEPVTYLGARMLNPHQITSEVFDFRSWYLMMGDSDVF